MLKIKRHDDPSLGTNQSYRFGKKGLCGGSGGFAGRASGRGPPGLGQAFALLPMTVALALAHDDYVANTATRTRGNESGNLQA